MVFLKVFIFLFYNFGYSHILDQSKFPKRSLAKREGGAVLLGSNFKIISNSLTQSYHLYLELADIPDPKRRRRAAALVNIILSRFFLNFIDVYYI
jgi:hypothetical protein